MATFVSTPNLRKVINELPEVKRLLESTAVGISTLTDRLAADHLYRTTVVITRGRFRVTTKYPFAHLEEWGSVNNIPRAPMRRAASRFGRFEPTPKATTPEDTGVPVWESA